MTKHRFHVMAFPNGPLCNLNCTYCYYLDKIEYYDQGFTRMTEDVLEAYIQQYIAAHAGPQIDFGWQGGEPTLRGLDFYKQVVELQKRYLPADWSCQNSLQTNGVLLNEEWCQFLSENDFLVGVSLDGPQHLHDQCRKDQQNNGTCAEVVKGVQLLKKHNVNFNILSVVSSYNAHYPKEVYDFYKTLGADFIQFIPLVESGDRKINESTVRSGDYGTFLITVFNEWLQHDYGRVFIQIFEEAVRAWAGHNPSLCVFAKNCGNALVMEHNGDVYSCDHFVSPEYKLGNIQETPLHKLINSQEQQDFGHAKSASLAQDCLDCRVRFVCQGGCPKNRLMATKTREKINYLCADYKRFFTYILPFMQVIVEKLREGLTPVAIKNDLQRLYDQIWDRGRNDLCPCGSGEKYKKCCLRR